MYDSYTDDKFRTLELIGKYRYKSVFLSNLLSTSVSYTLMSVDIFSNNHLSILSIHSEKFPDQV